MKAVLINSASQKYTDRALNLIATDYQGIEVIAVTQSHAFEYCRQHPLVREVFLVNSVDTLKATFKEIRQRDPDICVSLFSGEAGHRKLKLLSLLCGCKHRLIITYDFKHFFLTLRTWPRFVIYLASEERNLMKHILSMLLRPILTLLSVFTVIYLLLFGSTLFIRHRKSLKRFL